MLVESRQEAIALLLRSFGLRYSDGSFTLINTLLNAAHTEQAAMYFRPELSMSDARELMGFSQHKMSRICKSLAANGVLEIIEDYEYLRYYHRPVYRKSVRLSAEFCRRFAFLMLAEPGMTGEEEEVLRQNIAKEVRD